jgi:hypothetical protein
MYDSVLKNPANQRRKTHLLSTGYCPKTVKSRFSQANPNSATYLLVGTYARSAHSVLLLSHFT